MSNNHLGVKVNALIQRRESFMLLFIILVFAAMSLLAPDTFFTEENLFNILKQISLISIIAIGQTFILITGGIDLSVGYSLGLVGIVMTKFLSFGLDPKVAILLGLLTGVTVGFLNGLLITTLKLPPFIVTLGMANIARGFTYVITKGFPIPLDNEFISELGNGYWGAIPIMTVIMLILVLVAHFTLSSTTFGNRVLGIGGNETATLLSGINVKKYKIIVYTITGFLCGIAGTIMVGRLNGGNPNAGLNFDMDSIAAAIVGGTALAGGEGSIVGTILGALLLGTIRNALVLLNVNMYWQTVVVGVIIIAVCGIDNFAQSKKS
ncbi:MAG TPA: ABC transporter permease [Anaerovoracaceae bacterium]|nr:ABC transporter permease [Anaerovoracaceae bacterium]